MKKLLFASFLLLALAGQAQENFDSVLIKTTRITNSVYMFEGAGGNIGVLVGNDGIILIDDQFGPLSDKIKAALKAISDKPVKFVINTHYHFDHSGGNVNFGNDGAIIVSHENTRKRLSADQFMAAFNTEQKATAYEGLPKITFTESVTLNLNGETVQVFHVKNAHTDGDVIIYFKNANVVHAGDVFVRYGLPFIDQGNGGTIDGMIAGSERILTTSNESTVIIPGHGQLATKKNVLEYKNMLQTVRARVADGIKKGKSLDAIIASDPGRGYTAAFDKAAFVNTVYYSLKK